MKNETVAEVLAKMAAVADQNNRSSSSVGGIIANVIDDCRRLLAEAARDDADGAPDLDRFYGRTVPQPRADRDDWLFNPETCALRAKNRWTF